MLLNLLHMLLVHSAEEWKWDWRQKDKIAANVLSAPRCQALHQALYMCNIIELEVHELGSLTTPILQMWQLRIKGKRLAWNYEGRRAWIWDQPLTPQNPDHFSRLSTSNSPSSFKYTTNSADWLTSFTSVVKFTPAGCLPSLLNLTL